MPKNQFSKVKNSLLELGKKFIELEDRELKDIALKLEKEIVELFLKGAEANYPNILAKNSKTLFFFFYFTVTFT